MPDATPKLVDQGFGPTKKFSSPLVISSLAETTKCDIIDASDLIDASDFIDNLSPSPPRKKHPMEDEDFKTFSCSARSLQQPEEKKVPEDDESAPDLKQQQQQLQKEQQPPKKRFVTPRDFELLTVIGMGAFGKVLQVRNRHSNQILAMKVISKRLLKRKSSYVENIHAERDIMTKIRHPFVVAMHCSFQSKEKLFLIMEYCSGGELFLKLGREGVFLEKEAAFYLGEIILALEHLHGKGVLHRDLKPENILVGGDGHLVLTDFGLAKEFEDEGERQVTICGTGEYMAPEMVARKGYGKAADYWSLGCIAYEMLSGSPPFRSKNGTKDLFRKILNDRIKMPPNSSASAHVLLKGLLTRDSMKRLGTKKGTMFQVGGVAELKQVDFFSWLDWGMLESKEIDPPIWNGVDGDTDLKHFHEDFLKMTLPRSVTEMSRNSFKVKRCESDTFRNFSFVHDDFALPDRTSEEHERYWNTIESDGESLSECASSIVDGEGDRGVNAVVKVPPSIPEKKKRPPRKKKKKKGVTEETNNASEKDGVTEKNNASEKDNVLEKNNNPEPDVNVKINVVLVPSPPETLHIEPKQPSTSKSIPKKAVAVSLSKIPIPASRQPISIPSSKPTPAKPKKTVSTWQTVEKRASLTNSQAKPTPQADARFRPQGSVVSDRANSAPYGAKKAQPTQQSYVKSSIDSGRGPVYPKNTNVPASQSHKPAPGTWAAKMANSAQGSYRRPANPPNAQCIRAEDKRPALATQSSYWPSLGDQGKVKNAPLKQKSAPAPQATQGQWATRVNVGKSNKGATSSGAWKMAGR